MSEYKLVYRAYGLLDATSIELLLKSFEIPAEIIQESLGVTYGLTLGKLGSANVYVPEENLAEASRILEMMESGELEVPTVDQIDEAESGIPLEEEESPDE